MLLCIDCGNTNTVFSVWDGTEFLATFRASTEHQRTADQYYVWLSTLMKADWRMPPVHLTVTGAMSWSWISGRPRISMSWIMTAPMSAARSLRG